MTRSRENAELSQAIDVSSDVTQGAPYVERSHPLIETIGGFLNLTSEQIDNAFVEASLL